VAPNLPRREIPGARAVARNTLETLVFRGLSTPVALLLVVVQSRFLEPEGRGAFVLAVLGVTIFSRLLGQLGLAVTNRAVASGGELRGLVRRALATGAGLGVLGALVLLGWGALTDDVELAVVAIAACGLAPNVLWQTVSGVLLGQARVRLWNYIQVLPPVLTLAGTVVLVVGLDGGVREAVAAWTAAHAVTAAVALAASKDLWWPPTPPPLADDHTRALVRLALGLGAVQVVNLVSYRIELFVLTRFDGLGDVGIYSIAMQAAEAMWLIPAAVATAVTAPAVHETEERAAALVARATARGLAFTALAAVAVGVVAPFAIPLALGEEFEGAWRPLLLLLPGVVAYAPVTVLVVYISVRRGRPRLSLAVSLTAMAVTVAASLALIPPYGVSGAAAASATGYVVGGALAWVLFVRLAGLRLTGRRKGKSPR
jgi:O-antigen/teichoic acid export membrane protein